MKIKFYLQTSMITLMTSLIASQASASIELTLERYGYTDTSAHTKKQFKINSGWTKEFLRKYSQMGASADSFVEAKANNRNLSNFLEEHAGERQLKQIVGAKQTENQKYAARIIVNKFDQSKFGLSELDATIYGLSSAYNAMKTVSSASSTIPAGTPTTQTTNGLNIPVLSSPKTSTTPITNASNMPVIDSLDTSKTPSVSTPTVPVISSSGISTTPVTSASNMPTIGTVTTPILSTVSTTPISHLLNISSSTPTAPTSSLSTTAAPAASTLPTLTFEEMKSIVLLQNDQLGSTTPVAKPTPDQVETVMLGSTLKIRQQVAWCIQTESSNKLVSDKLALATLTSKTNDAYQFDLVFHNGQTDLTKGFTANIPQQFNQQAFSVAIANLLPELQALDLQHTVALTDLTNDLTTADRVLMVNPVIVPKS